MKTDRTLFPARLYARWVNATWPILTGRPNPASPIPRAAQTAADNNWEGEGGSLKPPKNPSDHQ